MIEENRIPTNLENSDHVSNTPSGFFGNSENMIVELENFMTEEEHDILFDFAKNNTSWDFTITKKNENGTVIYDANPWMDRVATLHTLQKTNQKVVDIIYEMFARLKNEVSDFFNIDCEATTPAIVRWNIGDRQEPHADKELHEGPDAGTPNAFPWYDIASIFYINDDYEGGELYFPLQGIEFKPKKRAAYFFPGDMNYIHGVRPVLQGTRYTSPFFWTIKKHKEKNE
jgi:hypothetical protein